MNWTAVQAVIHTFAIAHNAYVSETDWNETLIYDSDKIIFQRAKLSVFPCAMAKAATNKSKTGRTPIDTLTLIKVNSFALTTKICVRHNAKEIYFNPTIFSQVLERQLREAWALT
jgi:hypothetical protein